MNNKYLDHMHTKPTHERRQHAMRVAGVVTALVFAGWVTTLGMRLGTGSGDAQVAETSSTNSDQTAAVLNSGFDATQGGNQLIVSTTTDY